MVRDYQKKSSWNSWSLKQYATQWQHQHHTRTITKFEFGLIFNRAWKEAATVGTGVSAFQSTGIFPLNRRAIPAYKLNIIATDDNTGGTVDLVSTEEQFNFSSRNNTSTQDPTPSCSRESGDDTQEQVRQLLPSPQKATSARTQRKRRTTLHITSPQNILTMKGKQNASTAHAFKGKKKPGRFKNQSKRTNLVSNVDMPANNSCNFCKISYDDPRSAQMGDWIQCQSCRK